MLPRVKNNNNNNNNKAYTLFIVLRCKWPSGPYPFNKLIDWLIEIASGNWNRGAFKLIVDRYHTK